MHPTTTVFSTPNCMGCRGTKRRLDELGVSYREVDLAEHPDEAKRLRELGFSSAPVVEVQLEDGVDRWDGYRPDRLNALGYLAGGRA